MYSRARPTDDVFLYVPTKHACLLGGASVLVVEQRWLPPNGTFPRYQGELGFPYQLTVYLFPYLKGERKKLRGRSPVLLPPVCVVGSKVWYCRCSHRSGLSKSSLYSDFENLTCSNLTLFYSETKSLTCTDLPTPQVGSNTLPSNDRPPFPSTPNCLGSMLV